MKRSFSFVMALALLMTALLGLFSVGSSAEITQVNLSDLSYMDGSQAGWSTIKLDVSVNGNAPKLNNGDGSNPMVFSKAVVAHADSVVYYDLSAMNALLFTTYVGVCADCGGNGTSSGTTDFEVIVDDVSLYKSAKLGVYDKAEFVSVNIPEGAQVLKLVTTTAGDGGSNDHSGWFEPKLYVAEEGVVLPTSISFEKDCYTVAAGSVNTLNLTAIPAAADLSAVEYSVADPSVAEISKNGVLYTKGVGETVISAQYPLGNLSATAVLRVYSDGNYVIDEDNWEVRSASDRPIPENYPAANLVSLPIAYGNTNLDVGNSLLMDAPDGDFVATVKLGGGFDRDYQLVGLVAYGGYGSMVTMARRYHSWFSAKNNFCLSTYVEEYTDLYVADPQPMSDAWVKLEKKGEVFTGYYSYDGVNWIQVPETITSDVAYAEDLQIGVTAMTSSGGFITVPLSDFTLNGKTVPFCVQSGDLEIGALVGKETQLVSALVGEGSYEALTYSSEDQAIATIDASGKITGVKPGIVTVSATNGSKTQSFTVKVADSFVGALGESWQILNPYAPEPTFTDYSATIKINAGDFGTGKTIKNLVLTDAPDGDFDIRVKVTGGLSTDFESVGLVAYESPSNGVAMERRSHSYFGGNVFCITDWENDKGNEPYVAETDRSAAAWLRLVKNGNVFTGYYSYDAVTWTMVSSQENEAVASCEDLKIGLISRSGSYGSDKSATYTDFTVNGQVLPFLKPDSLCALLAPKDVTVAFGSDYTLPETLKGYMASGSVKDVEVTLDDGGLDINTAGVYTITATAQGKSVTFKVIVSNAYDMDGDTEASIVDVTLLLARLSDTDTVLGEGVSGDIDGDGNVGIGDVTAILNYLSSAE